MTFRLDYYEPTELAHDRPPLGADPRRRDRRTRPPRRSRAARAGRRGSRTGSCGACATSPRCGTTGEVTTEIAREALELLEVDDEGLERTDRELLRAIVEQVRRRPGRALDARGRARRGAGHDRGRLRAVPAPARLPPAHAARPDRHRARPRARRRGGQAARASALLSARALGSRVRGPARRLRRRGIHRRIESVRQDAATSGSDVTCRTVELGATVSRFTVER